MMHGSQIQPRQYTWKRRERRPSVNRQMLTSLREAGLHANAVSRNRRTGIFCVEFLPADIDDFQGEGTDPARVWARRIQERFEGVKVVGTYDTRADWRPQKPVLCATVLLAGELKPKDDAA